MSGCELSIVVPAFREGEHLAQSIAIILEHVERATPDYELILVDDGSPDRTWAVISELHQANPRIKGIRFSRNFGKEYAIVAGLENCQGNAALVMDSDLQHPPALIPKFYELWKSGAAEVIEGVKEQRRDEPWLSLIPSLVFNRLATWAAGFDFNNSSDFKLLGRRAIDAWVRLPERRCFFRGMATWIGFPRVQVKFKVDPRLGGTSKWPLRALIRLALLAVTSYSVMPLRLIHVAAALFLAFAFGLTIRALYLYFSGQAFSGFTTVIIVLLLIGGLVLLSLGIIAEYIAALYEEIKSRPRYIVADYLR